MCQQMLNCIGFLLCSATAVCNAGTITVNDAGDAGPGNCTATCTLRDAIANVATGGTITFALTLPATIILSGQELLIYKSLNIAGPGADKLSISGGGKSRVLEIANAAAVSIAGVTITGGRLLGVDGASDSSGTTTPGDGGIAQGGAIYVNAGSTLWLANCDIHDNVAGGGSGGDEHSPHDSISAGTGGTAQGGALYDAGDVGVNHCSFHANSATGGRGGIVYDQFQIANDTGGVGGDGQGGAIAMANTGRIELINVTLTGNSANGGGGGEPSIPILGVPGAAGGNANGGALSISGFSVFEFVTSAANSAVAGPGGYGDPHGPAGIATANDLLLDATLVARSSVFGSAAPACTLVAGSIQAQGVNLDSDGSCPGFTLHADPMLAPLAQNVGGRYVKFPQYGSPLIDAAADCQDAFGGSVTDDELGTHRPQGSKCDLGAIEADYIFVDGFGE